MTRGASATRTCAWTAVGMALLLVCWCGLFIYRSSFVIPVPAGPLGEPQRFYCLFDDAMISMRYAHNLVHGDGLVWNPGAAAVEGYTDPLWVLVMAGMIALFGTNGAVLGMQVLGLLIAVALVPVMLRLTSAVAPAFGVAPSRTLFAVAALLGVAYYPLLYWTLMGLEVGAITLVLALALMAYFTRPQASWAATTASALAAYFLRPDAILLFAPLFALQLGDAARAPRQWRKAIVAAAIGIALIGAHLAWRWSYYGSLVPNTYVLKMTGIALDERLANGLRFIALFLAETAPVIAVAALACLARPGRAALALGGAFLIALAYQVWIGGDGWPYWRFMAPTLPPLGVLAALGIVRAGVAVTTRPGSDRKHPARLGIAALTIALFVAANGRFIPEIVGADEPFQVDRNRDNVYHALAIDRVLDVRATLALFYAGAVGYYTGMTAIDVLGKADAYVSHLPQQFPASLRAFGMTTLPGHNKFDLAHSIEATEPDYAERFNWGGQSVVDWAQTRYIIVSLRFADGVKVDLPIKRGSDHLLR